MREITARGRAEDRAGLAGAQDHEVGYESKKTGRPKAAVKDPVKDAVKETGNSRKKVESKLGK